MKLHILLNKPTEAEKAVGRPLVGPTGEFVNDVLAEFPDLTHTVGYVGEGTPPDTNCILALGTVAFHTATGRSGSILKYRGGVMPGQVPTIKVVPTLHPDTYKRRYFDDPPAPEHYYKYLIQDDIRKACKEAVLPGPKPSTMVPVVARGYKDFYEWLATNERPGPVSVDIETPRTIPACVGFSFDGRHGISVPLLSVYGISLPESELLAIWELVDKVLREHPLIGQFLKFDWEKLYHAFGFRPKEFYADSLMLAAMLEPELPRGLGFLASRYTDEIYWKDEGKDFWTEGGFKRNRINDLLIYNAKDAIGTYRIVEAQLAEAQSRGLMPLWESHFKPLHDIYTSIEREGLPYDFDVKCDMYLKYLLRKVDLEKELFGLTRPGFNHRSPIQMKELFYETLRFPLRESLDEDTLVALYANHTSGPTGDNKRKIIDLILSLKKVDKAIQFCHTVPDWDGRYRTVYRPTGTETGRSSTSIQSEPQRREITVGKKKFHLGLAFQTIAKHGELGKDARRQFITPPGWVFLESDLSQAEARIVAHLAGDTKTLELFNTTDIHKLTTTWIFGIPYDHVTKDLRFVGKTCRHAGNYGMGKARLLNEIMTGAKKNGFEMPRLDEKGAGVILDNFHTHTPMIRGVFHTGIQGILTNNSRVLVNPYGRERQFLGYWGPSLFQEGYAQIPQSTVRDKMITVMVSLRAALPGIRICREDHDALTLIVKEDEVESVAKIWKSIMESSIDFSKCSIPRGELVIPCDFKVGNCLADMRELKVT